MALSIVILAAGQGKRMYSNTPKVLHHLGGKPLLKHVVHTATQLLPDQAPIIIYGHKGDTVRSSLADLDVTWIEQNQQLGTGHALLQALPNIPEDHRVLVLYGDVPLISYETLKNFLMTTSPNEIGIITADFKDPKGLGRIIRNAQQQITHIVEEKDLIPDQQQFNEINTGIYLFPSKFLKAALPQLQNTNAQKEYYLTDVIPMALKENITISSLKTSSTDEVSGINDRVQLAKLERAHQQQLANQLMEQGVTLRDPARFDVRGELSVGMDVTIDINVICEGRVVIGNHCIIGPNTILRNVVIGDYVEVKANSVLDGAEVGDHCQIGPFARLRPGTVLQAEVHVGNFVEIKNSLINQSSKVNHLSYIGDTDIGKRVNVGAGTITCNYDGVNKHKTIIKDGAFIGSNTSLVAPVTIGEEAYIGTSSVITRDAPPYLLTICRAREQCSIENWKKPNKKES